MQLRVALPSDADEIRRIYAPYVLGSPATFDTQVPSTDEISETISQRLLNYPWLVAEAHGRLVGYAYGSQHRTRAAYRWSVDVSVYVDAARHGQGIGRRLYEKLLPLLRRQGYVMAHAGITLPNPRSVALHEKFGFRQVGVFPRVGYEQGAWRDVGWWAVELQPPSDATPPEPLPFDQAAGFE